MGFSVSGATAIILLAGILAFGIAFTAATNSFEVVSDAQDDRADRLLDQQSSDIEITAVRFNETEDLTAVDIENNGVPELAISGTDLVVDGRLQTDEIVETNVDGDTETDLWLPGETLTVEVEATEAPDRVKVTAETGVADLEVIDNG